MSTSRNTPKLQKGALIGLDPYNPLASIVIFQYNPETLRRTVRPRTASGEASAFASARLDGPPEETIQLDLEIDATDQLESDKFPGNSLGIYPTLSSLEMLVYPKSVVAIANEVLLAAGAIELIPAEAPLTLFVWGLKRIVPVRVTDITITEQEFDASLNPVRAEVSISLNVLTYRDQGLLSPTGVLFMAHQIVKEVMASIGGVAAVADGFSAGGSFSFSIGG